MLLATLIAAPPYSSRPGTILSTLIQIPNVSYVRSRPVDCSDPPVPHSWDAPNALWAVLSRHPCSQTLCLLHFRDTHAFIRFTGYTLGTIRPLWPLSLLLGSTWVPLGAILASLSAILVPLDGYLVQLCTISVQHIVVSVRSGVASAQFRGILAELRVILAHLGVIPVALGLTWRQICLT